MPVRAIKTDGNTIYALLPEECPRCKSAIIPSILHATIFNTLFTDGVYDKVAVVFGCPACKDLFCGIAVKNENSQFVITSLAPVTPKKTIFEDAISQLSQGFVEIYNQAEAAEAFNLFEIAGIGYRKALEFLIKDYAISLFPSEAEPIKSKRLAKCIDEYINSTQIKAVATAAVWLGNDEAHYIRKWQDKDISSLKKFINTCVHWIMIELNTKEALNMIT